MGEVKDTCVTKPATFILTHTFKKVLHIFRWWYPCYITNELSEVSEDGICKCFISERSEDTVDSDSI